MSAPCTEKKVRDPRVTIGHLGPSHLMTDANGAPQGIRTTVGDESDTRSAENDEEDEMTDAKTTAVATAGTDARPAEAATPGAEMALTGPLHSEYGRTTITDTVVSKIAGIAAREVPGVYALGGGTARAIGMLRERIPGSRTNLAQGVSVEVGEKQAAVDLEIVTEYGVSIADLAQGIRRNVINAVEQMTGLEVTEVNIVVNDVHLEGEDDDADDVADREPRVQ